MRALALMTSAASGKEKGAEIPKAMIVGKIRSRIGPQKANEADK